MSRRGWVPFAAVCVLWGIPYLLIKVLLLGEPLTATVLAAFALILLGSVLATRQRRVRQDRWA